ncbi:MAG: PIG-L family deacetylase [Clostridia bacterium]|nr:PIG-L family deacetylase [Clostridia bacterium]
MSLTRLALRFAAPVPRIEDFDRYLFIGPHPDDIEIGAGATAAKLAASGKQVCFLICTDGRYGEGHVPETGDALAALRRDEAIRAAAVLGVHDVRFLDLCDGGFYEQDALLFSLAKVVGEFAPDIILAPDPCVGSEGHPDHLNAGRAAQQIAVCAVHRGIMARYGAENAPVQAIAFYMTAKPNRFVRTAGFIKRQFSAIFDCFPSQFPPQDPTGKSIALYLKLRALDFGLRSFKGCAEGFRVLGALHMHCMPEMD